MLQEAIQRFASDRDAAQLAAAVAGHFHITGIAPEVVPYLCGEVDLNGFYTLEPFAACCDAQYSYARLFGKHGEDLFPALNFGSDGSGVEFWLLLETGQVITLHHDATFYEVAGDLAAASGAAFTKEFGRQGSLFSLSQMLRLQALTQDLDEGDADFGRDLFIAAAQALGKSYSAMGKLVDDNRFEFVATHCGDFLEESGLETLKDAEKKLGKLATAVKQGKPVKQLDLSYCHLRQVPLELAGLPGIETLDLGGNPLQSLAGLATVRVQRLALPDCGLTEVKDLPAGLVALDLSNNPLVSLAGLRGLQSLQQVELQHVDLPAAELAGLQQALPGCKLVMEAPGERRDKELSLWYSTAKKIAPEVSSYTRLEKANLKGNENLDLQDAFKRLGASAKTLKVILTDSKTTHLPSEIVQFQALETIELSRHQIGDLAAVEQAYTLLAQLPKLKSVPLLSTLSSWSSSPVYLEIYLKHLPNFPNIEDFAIPKVVFSHPRLWDQMLEILEGFLHLKRLTLVFDKDEDVDLTAGRLQFLRDRIQELIVVPDRTAGAPAGIFDLTGLESLEVREYEFGSGDDLSVFQQLKRLKIGRQYADEFPWKGLENLMNLEHLEVTYFPRDGTLPASLSALTNLRCLSIHSEHGLQTIPDIFGGMTQLESLKLDGRFRLDELPASMGKLASLKTLEINANFAFYADSKRPERQFDHFPPALGELAALERLKLRTGVVPDLTAAFCKLTRLEDLDWSMSYGDGSDYFKGKKLLAPIAPGELRALRKFGFLCHARNFQIDLEGWYEAFLEMPALESLKMAVSCDAHVPPLPAEFGTHPTLKAVDFSLSYAKYVENFPHNMPPENFLTVLSQLPQLERLEVGYAYHLKTIPEALGRFRRLVSLKLHLADVPEEEVAKALRLLAQVPSLRKLSLAVEQLPREIALLSHLEALELHKPNGWGLADYPDALLGMQNLQRLHSDFDCKAARKKQLEKALPNCVINRGQW